MKIEEARHVAKRAARLMKLGGTPRIRLSRSRGHAHTIAGWFSLPAWALERHSAFAVAYIIHELSHFRTAKGMNVRRHGPELRRVESTVAEAFGLRLAYRGTAYLDSIRDLATGMRLCDGYGKPSPSSGSDQKSG
jgi:hypothetical protein